MDIPWWKIILFVIAAFWFARMAGTGELRRQWDQSFLWFRPSWHRERRAARRAALASAARVAAVKSSGPVAPKQSPRHMSTKFAPGPRDWEQPPI